MESQVAAPAKRAVRGGQDRVEAVERAIVLLQCFKAPGEALTLATLAQRSGFYKSTILRLAGSLQATGFLSRGTDGRYQLGAELRRLGDLSRMQVPLEPLIRPVLQGLTAQTCETASFYVRDGDERICLYRENSPLSVRHHLEEGTRHPLDRGAAGRVLSLWGVPSRSAEALRLHNDGFLVSRGGRDPDLASMAVPVLNQHGQLLGALTVSGLLNRLTEDKLIEAQSLLREAQTALQKVLPRQEDIDPPPFR